jgi:hypothetical protein
MPCGALKLEFELRQVLGYPLRARPVAKHLMPCGALKLEPEVDHEVAGTTNESSKAPNALRGTEPPLRGHRRYYLTGWPCPQQST